MGPVIIKKEDSSGTEYAISALPLGGYVAMLSEKALQEDNALRDTLTKDQLNNTFESKPRWQRALVMLAGPLANFILSIFIFFFIIDDGKNLPLCLQTYFFRRRNNKIVITLTFNKF